MKTAKKTTKSAKSPMPPALALAIAAVYDTVGNIRVNGTVTETLAQLEPAYTAMFEALALARKLAAPALIAAMPAPAKPVVKLVVEGNWVKVASPFNRDFVNDLKKLPYADRKWNKWATVEGAESKGAWVVLSVHKATVEALVAKHYNA